MKQLSADDRVPEGATEDLGDQLEHLVRHLVGQGVTLAQARKIFERQFILASLQRNRGNITQSAGQLGIHRNTLRSKVQALRIQSADYRTPSRRQQAR